MVCAGPLELIAPPLGNVLSLAECRRQCKIPVDITSEDADLQRYLDDAETYCQQEIYGERQFLQATYQLPLAGWWECPLRLPRPPLLWLDAITYYDTAGVLQTLVTSAYEVRTPWRQPGTVEWAPQQSGPALQADRRWPVLVRFTAGYAAPFTADATADTITVARRTFANGDVVRVSAAAGSTLPPPLIARRNYYAVNASGESCQLSLTSGGAALNLTEAGDGSLFVGEVPGPVRRAMLMLVSHWFENREAAGAVASKEVEFSVSACLRQEAWGSYA